MTEEQPSHDELIKAFIASTIYKDSLNDAQLYRRLTILTTIVDYVLRKTPDQEQQLDTAVLTWKLQKKYNLNSTSDPWLTLFEHIVLDTKIIYDNLERICTTKLRGQYPSLIAELLYQKHKQTFDALPL